MSFCGICSPLQNLCGPFWRESTTIIIAFQILQGNSEHPPLAIACYQWNQLLDTLNFKHIATNCIALFCNDMNCSLHNEYFNTFQRSVCTHLTFLIKNWNKCPCTLQTTVDVVGHSDDVFVTYYDTSANIGNLKPRTTYELKVIGGLRFKMAWFKLLYVENIWFKVFTASVTALHQGW